MSSQDGEFPVSAITQKLGSLGDEELDSLWNAVDAEMKRREARKKQEAKKHIVELAAKYGIDLGTLSDTRPTIRYRDPNNPFNTWSGRGRKPRWVVDALEGGLTLDQLRVADN